MLKSMSFAGALIAVFLTADQPALAKDGLAGALKITHAHADPTPNGARTGEGFVVIANTGRVADRLVGASSPAAGAVEIHHMSTAGGVMSMRQVPAVDLPAGQTLDLQKTGYHLMFVGLKQSFKAGQAVRLTLRFVHAPKAEVSLAVTAPTMSGGMAGMPGM